MFSRIRSFFAAKLASLRLAWNRLIQAIFRLIVRKLASTTVQIAKNEAITIALNVSPIAIPVLQTLGYWQALQAMVTVSYLVNGVVISAYIGLFWQTFIILVVSTWVCFYLADKLKGLQTRYLYTHSIFIR